MKRLLIIAMFLITLVSGYSQELYPVKTPSTSKTFLECLNEYLASATMPSHNHVKANITDFPVLATVATSGSYADLTNKPSMLTPSNNLSDVANAGTARTNLGLSTVAATGSYNDLSNRPTLGTLASQNGTFSGTSSGTNTGDQTIILTGDVTGSGTGSFATTFKTSPSFTTPNIGAATGTSLATTGAISSSGTAGIGYATGAGGTVTQTPNKTSAVTLSKITGQVTTSNAALAAATIVSFTLTNTTISATDHVIVTHQSGGTSGAYSFNAFPGAGSAVISIRNNTAGSLSEALVLKITVIKSVTN